MKSRWFLRGFFLALLALCVGGSAWSHYRETDIFYRHGDTISMAGLDDGMCIAGWVENTDDLAEEGFSVQNGTATPLDSIRTGFPDAHYFAGFLLINDREGANEFVRFGVPLWFLASMSLLNLVYAWRRAGRPKRGGAFPVELDKMGDGVKASCDQIRNKR